MMNTTGTPTREEALALAKRILQQLARLVPGGGAYRERAAVLVDVLAYAGHEADADDLALVLQGRYSAPGVNWGCSIPVDYQADILEARIDDIRKTLLERRQRCGLSPKTIRSWLQTLLHRFARPEVDARTLQAHANAIARHLQMACAAGGNIFSALDAVTRILRNGDGLHFEHIPSTFYRDTWFNYIDVADRSVPTLAVVYPRAHSKLARFVIAPYDELRSWSEGERA